MRVLHAFGFYIAAMLLASCGGGVSSTSTMPAPFLTPVPGPSSSNAQTVSSAGGSLTVTNGALSATITVPPGALAGSATLKVTFYQPNSLPVAFSKARRPQSGPAGSTAIAGLVVDTGGVALSAPLTISFGGFAGSPAGTSVLLSGYANSAWADVATTSFAGAIYTETANPHYPGITLSAQTPYVLYSIATSAVAAPTATVTVTGPATVGAGNTATYVAQEATSNGFPFLGHTFAYAVSSAAVGTIGATTGVLTGSVLGAAGTVTATDSAVSGFAGTAAVAVVSARPGTGGLTEQYTGTLNEIDANNAISSSPVSTTTTAKATVAVTTASATDGSGNTIFTANESDAGGLATTTAATVSTVAYQVQPSGSVNVRAIKTVATESSGVIYEHDYGTNNGLLTVLPETAGTFANDAAEEYKETDPGVGVANGVQQVTTDRTVAASGTYSANIQELNVFNGAPATDVATENADFSGSLLLNSVDPNAYFFNFSAPGGGQITVTQVDPNYPIDNVFAVTSWLPVQPQPSVEQDVLGAVTGLDSSCAPAAAFSGAPMLITQSAVVIDVVNGTVETRVIKTYDENGIGTVCAVVSDTVNSFYDFSGQEGQLFYFAPSAVAPVLTTTISETLSLQTSNAAQVASANRSTQAVGARAMLPAPMIAERVGHLARARAAARMAALRKNAAQSIRGGSVK